MKDSYPTTKEHFEIFKKEAYKWIRIFGLYNWEVFFTHEKWNDTRAESSIDSTGKVATINLSITWKNLKPTKEYIKEAAFHEVCELLLDPLAFLARERHITKEQIDMETHNIIGILEKVILKREL